MNQLPGTKFSFLNVAVSNMSVSLIALIFSFGIRCPERYYPKCSVEFLFFIAALIKGVVTYKMAFIHEKLL